MYVIFSCCNSATVRAWFLRALLIPETRYLNPNYFIFYEMSMGGAGKCGGYFTSRHGRNYNIRGAALGLGFGKRMIHRLLIPRPNV